MRRIGAVIVTAAMAAAALAAAPAVAQDSAPAPQLPPAGLAPDYTQDAAWLCLPGRFDACGRPLPTTALNPNGYGSVGQVVPGKSATADCFYVYPTVSRDRGRNSDLAPGLEEQITAQAQLARFGGVCRTFAPVYRQVTTTALPLAFAGENLQPNFDIAYGDVLAAWKDFLARRNGDRPFVLIGHSQGSIHLVRLIREEIEGKPVAKRMLSAILLGWSVEVPPGKEVGGTFKHVPICTGRGRTGCVVTYMSFRAEAPPPQSSFLGRAATPGMTAACTNPAALAGGKAPLDSYWFTLRPTQIGDEPIAWSKEGAPPTPFVRTEGLASGECRHDGSAGYLAISVNADPRDALTDRIPGDVYIGGRLNPGWGLHLSDMPLAQGDLIRLVEAQVAAVTASATPARRSTPKPKPRLRR